MLAESPPTHCAVIVMCTIRGHDAQNAVGYNCASVRPSIFNCDWKPPRIIVQELCESRGGRPGLSVLTSLLVSVDVKLY